MAVFCAASRFVRAHPVCAATSCVAMLLLSDRPSNQVEVGSGWCGIGIGGSTIRGMLWPEVVGLSYDRRHGQWETSNARRRTDERTAGSCEGGTCDRREDTSKPEDSGGPREERAGPPPQ